jgi:predicted nucleic acid-binding protein
MHVANASGARALRTEDRRDRRTVDVWRIINPFIAASNRIVGETLGP